MTSTIVHTFAQHDYLMLNRPGFLRDAVALYWWVKPRGGLQAISSDGRFTQTFQAPDALPPEYLDRVVIQDENGAAIAELSRIAAQHHDALSHLTALWQFARRRGASCDRLGSLSGEPLQLADFPALESAIQAAIRATLAEMERNIG